MPWFMDDFKSIWEIISSNYLLNIILNILQNKIIYLFNLPNGFMR